jgi:hypothetical protein
MTIATNSANRISLLLPWMRWRSRGRDPSLFYGWWRSGGFVICTERAAGKSTCDCCRGAVDLL